MGRSFRGRSGLPAPKRQIGNDGLSGTGFVTMTVGASTLGNVGFNTFLLVTAIALTLVRTRGEFFARLRDSGGADNLITGAYGQIVVSENAANVGITAVPVPLTDIENDWFVWVPFTLHADAAVGQPLDSPSAIVRIPFDSRGQRKLKQGEALVSIVEIAQSDATTGTIIDFVHSFRNQSKL